MEALMFKTEDFDAMFDASEDPWSFRTRWYEERKRALTLACLPERRYERAFEPGCANGELTAMLALRCDYVLATDGSQRAVQLARARNLPHHHVWVEQALLPEQFPSGEFDLIVLSEFGYYLDSHALDQTIARTRNALRPGGTVLACHWRRPIEGCPRAGDDVHRQLEAHLRMPRLMQMVDEDFRLDVWCADARSVGEREGLA
jgi:SAM-dependent methyltransferase